MFLTRNGYLEEVYADYNFIPIREVTGGVGGFLNVSLEITRQILHDRRTLTLLSMASLPDMASLWPNVITSFKSNPIDVPLVAVFSSVTIDDSQDIDYKLIASVGLQADFEGGDSQLHPILERANVAQGQMVVLQKGKGSLSPTILEGKKWRGFGKASSTVVVMKFTAGDVRYFSLLALNPRKALDEDFHYFLQLLSNQLSTSISSAHLMERARLNQADLSWQVAEGEVRFKTLTELNPVGMFWLSPVGEVL